MSQIAFAPVGRAPRGKGLKNHRARKVVAKRRAAEALVVAERRFRNPPVRPRVARTL